MAITSIGEALIIMRASFGTSDAVLPTFYTATLVRWLIDEGHTEAALLENTGLTLALLENPDDYINFRQHRQLLLNALRLSGDRHLGLQFGRRLNLTSMGMIGYAAMSRDSFVEAIDTIITYFRIQAPLVEMTFRRTEQGACIVMDETLDYGEIREFMFESFLGAADTVFAFLLNDRQPVIRAQGCLPRAADWDRHAHLLRFPVSFDQPRNALELDVRCLDLPLPTANPMAAKSAQKICDELLAQAAGQSDLAGKVRQLLLAHVGRFPNLEQAAAQLFISPRTLRRKLQQLDTTYQTVLDDTREGLAVRYLTQTRMSVQQIASMLGYTDPSNFGRAFRKWTGKSPSQYRG
ncbi:AraC family transcriptional regulator [Exilibacterium tricleocarpae]|uniref:AraC family transcriptional regulator n=1 Tax=Exilibacterium tricleocarpae TaxID=2591008 RepID=A0A545SS46_9GAMM|nr:AraC family transcriptional regulator [Exilibacterium tricleocarpae]TQV67797.1 AraC family transcriptional regulator [Exilibacterium tricleocarpae]